jgi:hypothetical protein
MGVAVARRRKVHCPLPTIRSKTVIGLVPRFSKRLQMKANPSPSKNEPAPTSLFHGSSRPNPCPPKGCRHLQSRVSLVYEDLITRQG